jgi:hypothetical protein
MGAASMRDDLIGNWPLQKDMTNLSPIDLVSTARDVETGVTIAGRTGARFNGTSSRLAIEPHPALDFGTGDVTVSAWVYTDPACDVVGDLVSSFDPAVRRGINLSIVTNGGVTSTSQTNYRNLHFGIDAGSEPSEWCDCGRPGDATLAFALAVVEGSLYAGTFERDESGCGRLWRYDGGQSWTDLGNPVGCNAISSIASFDGALYCGTGRYNPDGSALGPARNQMPGGTVYRVSPDGEWTYCGYPGAEGATPDDVAIPGFYTGKADEIVALTVFNGRLYCGSYHRPGVFRYEGEKTWSSIGLTDGLLMTLAVYRKSLFALLDGGSVFRYEGGSVWTDCGCPPGSEQTYGAVISHGAMYAGTWPEADVFRYDRPGDWHRVGRVGYEREVMGMVCYNGKVYLGSLPMANVWRMDDVEFTFLGTLDHSPAPLRRAWSLSVYDGRLFVSTLPSGHVHSIRAGAMATWDARFPTGWHHITAVKSGGELKLSVDGRQVAKSASFDSHAYDIGGNPFVIGSGAHSPFSGLISDLRVYRRAVDGEEISLLAADEVPR